MKKAILLCSVIFLLTLTSKLSATIQHIYSDSHVEDNYTFNDTVYIHTEGAIHNSGATHTITFNTTIINEGIIYNGENTLTVVVKGDIVNSGTWENHQTHLSGTANQHISGGGTISSQYFRNYKTAGDVIIDSDITFSNCAIDFQAMKNIIFSGAYSLNISGSYLTQATLTGVSGSILNMTNAAYLYDVDVQDMELQGICEIQGANVNFSGTTTLMGTLRNRDSYQNPGTMSISNNFINNGTITNYNSYTLNINLPNDISITNNGVWNHNQIKLIGTSDQHISCFGDSSFAIALFWGNSSRGNIYFDTDVEFVGTQIYLNNDNLVLQNGNTFSLSGGSLQNGSIEANSAILNMTNDAYLNNMNIEDSELQGYCEIQANDVTFNGTTTVTGTLRNKNAYQNFPTITVNDTLINNGTISNYGSWSLSMNISGDITNNGTWNNYKTIFNGISDQTILLKNANYITGDVRFLSDVTGDTYQWQVDSANLDSPNFNGETAVELDWNTSVSNLYLGTYRCNVNDTLFSRSIIVTEPITPIMEMSLVSPSSIDFGTLYVGQDSTQKITIKNDGNVNLSVSDLSFSTSSSSTFSYTYDNLNGDIAAGATDSIFVTFAPDSAATFNETIKITNNSTNNPLIEVTLAGTGEYDEIPAPANVIITLDNKDATISWDAVTQTVHGIAVTPDFYVINYNDDPNVSPDEYLHLTATTNLSIVHSRVVQFAPQMFYQVIAIKDYEGQYFKMPLMNKLKSEKTTWKNYKQKYSKK